MDCKSSIDAQEIYGKEKFSDYYAIIPHRQAQLSEHQYMLMASHMYAFILKDRTYGMPIGSENAHGC